MANGILWPTAGINRRCPFEIDETAAAELRQRSAREEVGNHHLADMNTGAPIIVAHFDDAVPTTRAGRQLSSPCTERPCTRHGHGILVREIRMLRRNLRAVLMAIEAKPKAPPYHASDDIGVHVV